MADPRQFVCLATDDAYRVTITVQSQALAIQTHGHIRQYFHTMGSSRNAFTTTQVDASLLAGRPREVVDWHLAYRNPAADALSP